MFDEQKARGGRKGEGEGGGKKKNDKAQGGADPTRWPDPNGAPPDEKATKKGDEKGRGE